MPKRINQAATEFLSDVFKRVPISGLGDKLPKEILSAAVANIEKFRHGVQEILATEIGRALSKVDIQRLMDELARNYSLKVEIQLEPKKKRNKTP